MTDPVTGRHRCLLALWPVGEPFPGDAHAAVGGGTSTRRRSTLDAGKQQKVQKEGRRVSQPSPVPPQMEHGIRTNKGGGGPGRSGDGQAGSHDSVLKRVLVALLQEGQLGRMISSRFKGWLDNCRVCTLRAGTGEKWRQVDKMTPPVGRVAAAASRSE